MLWQKTFFEAFWRLFLCLYFTGLIGIWFSPWTSFFISLTPLLILLTFLAGIAIDTPDRLSLGRLFICGVLGFLAEVAGVQKGWIFGDYSYGTVLGPSLWGVPIILIINWMWVLYGASVLQRWLGISNKANPFVTAAILIIYDFFLESFAIRFGLWQWKERKVPGENFVGWGIVSLLLASIWQPNNQIQNNLGARLFILQFLFFIVSYFIKKILE